MTYELPVLWGKISPDISKLLTEKLKAKDLKWGRNFISGTINGSKKTIKIIIE